MLSTREKIANSKIKMMQFDPFGWCNAKCWFCPVKYIPLPSDTRQHMPVELIEKIFSEIAEEKKRPDGLFDPNFDYFYTAHYNEVLLYKNLEQLFEISAKYGLKTMILSNGTTLTPERSDLINRYKNVIIGVCLNIPAFDAETWSKRAGFSADKFSKLVSNVRYYLDTVTWLRPSIQINSVDSITFADGWTKRGPKFFDEIDIDVDLERGELEQQFQLAKTLFPEANVFKNNGIIDRAGLLKEIIHQRNYSEYYVGKEVIGCNNGGDRSIDWLHVNAAGDAFICCNDYSYDYKFGNLTTNKIRDIWGGEMHINAIEKAHKEMCKNCGSAVWG
jgi:radical SAM protein with 4Fe4S-binding SPASM domain